MLSARRIYQEIVENDAAFRLFCSIAAKGESQGGWENDRIAALIEDRALAPKIARHAADEDKHGRIFAARLRKRGLEPVQVPEEVDYTALVVKQGIGPALSKLQAGEPLDEQEIVAYLAHSRVTEQWAAEQMRQLKKIFADHPDVGRAVKMIYADEEAHLNYCHEELLRFTANGRGREIRSHLARAARAEIRIYRDVSLAVMARMRQTLGWSRLKAVVPALGIHGVYVYERLGGHRRMTTLRMPRMRNPLGGPAAPIEADFA